MDTRASAERPRRVAVVTGSRAEFGLLTPVMRAIEDRPELELLVVAAGSHLVQPALTFRDVKALFPIADTVPMQVVGRVGRFEDVQAVGKGVSRFGRGFERLRPDWVVVLGDRIEAFAAATAASIGGIALAHLHGGDVAEGVADEAMRHAITKLAHLHLPATEASAARIRRMGEPGERIVVVGSPAIDGLSAVEPLDDDRWAELGEPEVLLSFHPLGRTDEAEEHAAATLLEAVSDRRVVALHPNFDPGRGGIMRALLSAPGTVRVVEHLKREAFVRVVKRLAGSGGVVLGNSSAGLIEVPALGCASVDVGDRQAGREAAPSVVRLESEAVDAVRAAVRTAPERSGATHPFGDGTAGVRTARALCDVDPFDPGVIRKRWSD